MFNFVLGSQKSKKARWQRRRYLGLNPIHIEETTVTGHCFFRQEIFEWLDLWDKNDYNSTFQGIFPLDLIYHCQELLKSTKTNNNVTLIVSRSKISTKFIFDSGIQTQGGLLQTVNSNKIRHFSSHQSQNCLSIFLAFC